MTQARHSRVRMALSLFASLCIIQGLLHAVLADARDSAITMRVKARDCILGEMSFGSDCGAFLVIQNDAIEPAKLVTSYSYPWMLLSDRWKVHIDGPIDTRCIEYEARLIACPAPGAPPASIGIPPESSKTVGIDTSGIGNAGSYTIQVEYIGDGAPDGFVKEHLVSDTKTFVIHPPDGVDADVVHSWQEQNPDTPWCMFPSGMRRLTILEQYPTSIYAGWALCSRVKSHPGGFPGPPSATTPNRFFEMLEDGYYRRHLLYSENLSSYDEDVRRILRDEEAAEWRRERIGSLLAARPDFPCAGEMRLRIALDALVQGRYKEARDQLTTIQDANSDTKAAKQASEHLRLMKENGWLQ